MRRFLKLIGWVLLALVAVLALFVLLLDWNDLRRPVEAIASRQLEREVVIGGELEVEFGRTPRVHLQQLRIANPPWSEHPHMAEVEAASFDVPLGSLLRGSPEFRNVVLESPVVRLERNAAGAANWDVFLEDGDEEPPPVEELTVREGRFHYRDMMLDAELDGHFASNADSSALDAEGIFQNAPLQVQARGGNLPLLFDPERPFPLELNLQYAEQTLEARGEIRELEAFRAFRFELAARGSEPSLLLRPFDLPMPDMDAFDVAGRLTRDGNQWQFEQVRLALDNTALQTGSLTLNTAAEPPRLEGELLFSHFNLEELFTFFGLDEEEERDRLFPDAPIPVDWLNTFQAHLKIRSADTNLWLLEGRKTVLTVQLDDGVLRLDPFNMDTATGQLEGDFHLRTQEGMPLVTTDLRLRGASLRELLRGTPALGYMSGRLFGHIQLEGRGQSLAEALGQSDGRVGLLVTRGTVDRALAEGLALNIIELLFGEGEPEQQLRCAIAAFDVNDGSMRAEALVIDTEERVILGNGDIDLERERLNLEFDTQAKEPGQLAAQVSVTIQGPILNPEVGAEEGELIPRVAAAVLGAVAAPLVGALAFIEPGVGEDRDCQGLVQEHLPADAPEVEANNPAPN